MPGILAVYPKTKRAFQEAKMSDYFAWPILNWAKGQHIWVLHRLFLVDCKCICAKGELADLELWGHSIRTSAKNPPFWTPSPLVRIFILKGQTPSHLVHPQGLTHPPQKNPQKCMDATVMQFQPSAGNDIRKILPCIIEKDVIGHCQSGFYSSKIKSCIS